MLPKFNPLIHLATFIEHQPEVRSVLGTGDLAVNNIIRSLPLRISHSSGGIAEHRKQAKINKRTGTVLWGTWDIYV